MDILMMGKFKLDELNGRFSDVGSGDFYELRMKDITSLLIFTKLEVRINKSRIVGAYGPGIENTR